MIKHSKYTIILLSFLFSTSIFAQKIATIKVADVQVPTAITIANKTLQLNGAGIRSKFFIDLYVGSLYLPEKSQNIDVILNAQQLALRLNITSSMISAQKMTDGINEGFKDATNGDTSKIAPQIQTFLALFETGIKEGDQFTFVFSKGSDVTTYKNNKKQGTIKGEDFSVALLNIWLGKAPAQQSLKDKMLGND